MSKTTLWHRFDVIMTFASCARWEVTISTNHCWLRTMTSYGVTRPQWVNSSVASKHLIWDMGCNIYHCANLNNLKNDTQSHTNCGELFMSVKLVCYLCSLSADDLAQLIVKNFHISFSSTQYSLQKTICGCRCLSNRSWCQITRPSEDQRTQHWLSSFYIYIYIYFVIYSNVWYAYFHLSCLWWPDSKLEL